MATRTSSVAMITLTADVAYAFAAIMSQSIREGTQATISIDAQGSNAGNPPLSDAQKAAVDIIFYTNAGGGTERADTELVGGDTLDDIVNVSYNSVNDDFDIAIDARNVDISADTTIFFALTVEQTD